MAPSSAPRLRWRPLATAAALLIVLLLPATAAAAGFEPAVIYPAGSDPRGIASGNLNGSGGPDLVTTSNGGGTLSVRLGLGDGTFGGSTPFSAGANPAGVVVTDLDADSDADMVYARLGNDIMAYRPGNGAGGFGAETGLPANDAPTGVVAADFNFDGKPDLATANNIDSDISVVPNATTVAGTFAFGAEVNVDSGTFPAAIATGDFNNDGKPDLATANQGGALGAPGSASVFYNTTATAGAAPAFAAAVPYSTGNVSTAIASGDFNNDNLDDLVVGSVSSANAFVLLSAGGAFTVSAGMPLGGGAGQGIAVGDFDDDGRLDFAAPFNAAQAGVKVFEGNGAGAFTDGGTAAINGAGDVTTNDFNGDGRDDLAISGGPPAAEVAVLINDPDTTLPPSPPGGGGLGGGGGGNPAGPDCANTTIILVSCANPSGRLPGVCGPSFASILPACYMPTVPPTVCGPSFGTILQPCQLKKPQILACGGFGTILPQCNQPPKSVPKVCGPSTGTILPPCTGANNLVLACGPSSGTPLPACNFGTQIKAQAPLEAGKSGTVDLNLKCPPKKAQASGSVGARAAQKKPETCTITTSLELTRTALQEALKAHAFDLSMTFLEAAYALNLVINITPGREAEQRRVLQQAEANRVTFLTRVGNAIAYVGANGGPTYDLARAENYLTSRGGPPPYVGPPAIGGEGHPDAIRLFALSVERAIKNYQNIAKSLKGNGSALPGARSTSLKRPRVVKRFKIRAGKSRRVRLKFSKKVVRTLLRDGRSTKSGRVVPVRLVLSYDGKLGGRRIPVARLLDSRFRVKAKPKAKSKGKARQKAKPRKKR